MLTFLIFIVVSVIVLYIIYMYCRGGVNTNYPDLTGKVVVVTGTNRGIGFEVVRNLAKLNATIVCLCRNEEAQIKCNIMITKETKNKNIEFIRCDLLDLENVKKCCEKIKQKYQKIDILINNAGIMASPFRLTKQNIESQMGTNHVGHAYLIKNLIPLLEKAEKPKIVSVSSVAHRWCCKEVNLISTKENYKPVKRYFESKLAVGMYIKQLSKEYPKITTCHCHPGIVYSNLWKDFCPWLMWFCSPFYKIFWKNPQEACQTVLYCALNDNIQSGAYYSDCKLGRQNKLIANDTLCKKLYDETNDLIKSKTN